MLESPYRWYFIEGAAYLDYNAGNVASVKPAGGRYRTTIRFRGHVHEGACGSLEQGMRWVDRWIAKHPGWPGKRPERWYDRAIAARPRACIPGQTPEK